MTCGGKSRNDDRNFTEIEVFSHTTITTEFQEGPLTGCNKTRNVPRVVRTNEDVSESDGPSTALARRRRAPGTTTGTTKSGGTFTHRPRTSRRSQSWSGAFRWTTMHPVLTVEPNL